MDFVLVQHAEKARGVGDAADPGLTDRGREQARLAGERLRALLVRRVIASPLRRARETALIIAAVLELDARGVETDPRLRERMNWGDGPVRQTLAEFLAAWSRATDDRDYAPPAGDSSRAAGARFHALLEELASTTHDPQAGPIALVSHGGVTVDLLRNLFPDDHLRSLNPHLIAGGVPGCALTRLSRDGGRYHLLDLASVAHLPVPLRTDWQSNGFRTP